MFIRIEGVDPSSRPPDLNASCLNTNTGLKNASEASPGEPDTAPPAALAAGAAAPFTSFGGRSASSHSVSPPQRRAARDRSFESAARLSKPASKRVPRKHLSFSLSTLR